MMALVNWDTCCKPLSNGALGMRKLKEHSMSFIMKLGFHILTNSNEFWLTGFHILL